MNRLKELRLENLKLQSDIAKILSISTSGYSLYEIEKRDIPTEYLKKLAEYYNVSVDYLLGISDVRTPIDIQDIKFANNGGKSVDITGLTDEDEEEIKMQVEYMRWKNEQKKK